MDLTPPETMTTEERLHEITGILLTGINRVLVKRRRVINSSRLSQPLTGLQLDIERSWTQEKGA